MVRSPWSTEVQRELENILPIDPISGFERLADARQDVRFQLGSGASQVTVDLLPAKGITSDLISFLLACEMECDRNGAHLRVLNVDHDMLKAFRFAGINQVIDFQLRP